MSFISQRISKVFENDDGYNVKYAALTFIASAFIIFGFLSEPADMILQGLLKIIVEPATLITDYIAVGGIGAAFVNAGILMLISIVMMFVLKVNICGLSVAAVFLMGGFALFGKNICNVWPIILGVALYARLRRQSFKEYVHVALLATSIAPLVTEFLFVVDAALPVRLLLSMGAGVAIGLLIVPLAQHTVRLHKGFNLYNVGFAVGILGTVFISIFKSYGYQTYTRLVWSTGNDLILSAFLLGIFLNMMLMAFILDRRLPGRIRRIFQQPGTFGGDFINAEGVGAVLFNMALNGMAATAYVLLVGGPLNGPTVGGILTVVGFGAYGKHLKNILPIFLGVFIGSLFKTWNIYDPPILLAALFGTALAPIAGHYGWAWGVVAGFVNSSVVLNSGILHGGMNLYNTGFSAGIVAAVLVPILDGYLSRRTPLARQDLTE